MTVVFVYVWALDHDFIIGAIPFHLILKEVDRAKMLRIDSVIENTTTFACVQLGNATTSPTSCAPVISLLSPSNSDRPPNNICVNCETSKLHVRVP